MANKTKVGVKDLFMQYYEIGNGGKRKELSVEFATVIFNARGNGEEIEYGDEILNLRAIEITSFLHI